MKTGLLLLHDMGFNQFARNKELMEKFCMNVEACAQALLEDDELYN